MSINPDIFKKYNTALGERLKALREDKGYSLNDLAAICDLEKTSISRIENGRTNITFKTALILSIGLEAALKDIFDFEIESEDKE